MISQFAIPLDEHYASLFGGLKFVEDQMAAAVCIGQCQGCMCSCRCSCSGGFVAAFGWGE